MLEQENAASRLVVSVLDLKSPRRHTSKSVCEDVSRGLKDQEGLSLKWEALMKTLENTH